MGGCLTTDQLLALESDALPAPQARRLLSHCESCATCRSLLEERRSNGSYAAEIRKAVLSDPSPVGSSVIRPFGVSRPMLPLMTADGIQGYEILGEIHRGGQGVVYRARQKSTGREVAIKVAFEEAAFGGRRPHRFGREIELASRLQHPNIITIFDSGTTADGRCYFVMDFVNGLSIDQYVRERELGLPDGLRLFVTICEAVNHAHQRGVMHRDLKPSNILVDTHGVPRLLDFGLAKALPGAEARFRSVVSAAGQLLGTVPYMAPEQLSGKPESTDIRTDVYALGVLLYEVLAGSLPYDIGLPASQMLKTIVDGSPEPPSHRWTPVTGIGGEPVGRRSRHTGCPVGTELDSIVLRAMSADPERRYQTAADLARDVQRYLAGEPVEASQDRRLYVLRKLVYRHRLPVAVATGFFLVLASALAIITTLYVKVEEQRVVAHSERDRAISAQRNSDWRAEELRRLMYLGHISSAASALEGMNLRKLKDELYVCTADLRGWEWYWLAGQLDSPRSTLSGHRGAVTALSARPGVQVVSGGADGTVREWDLSGLQQLGDVLPIRGDCSQICLSAGGDYYAVLSSLGQVTRHSRFDQSVVQLASKRPIRGVFFSPDSLYLATSDGEGWLEVYDASTGQLIKSMGPNPAACTTTLAFSPDGRLLATAIVNGTVSVYDWRSGTQLFVLSDQQECTTALLWTADSQRLISGGWTGSLMVWEMQSGRLERVYASKRALSAEGMHAHTDRISAIALSPDEKMLISADVMGNIGFWDQQTASLCGRLTLPQTSAATSLEFAGEGRWLVAGTASGELCFWDMAQLAYTVSIKAHPGPSRAVSFGPPGSVISGGDDGDVKLWDVGSARLLKTFAGHTDKVRSLACGPGGTWFVSGSMDRTLRIWNVESGSTTHLLKGHEDCVLSVAVSRDGRWIASGGSDFLTKGKDNSVRIWDSTGGAERMCLRGHQAGVTSVAFSPDGTLVVSGSRDGKAIVWDLSTGRRLASFEGHKGMVFSVAFTPDGSSVLSSGEDNAVHSWDPHTGKSLALPAKFPHRLHTIALSPDGSRKAGTGSWGYVSLWPAQDIDWELLRLRGSKAGVWSTAFSPDGRSLACVDDDGMLWIWRAMSPGDLAGSAQSAQDLAAGALRLRGLRQFRDAELLMAESLQMHHRLFGPDDPRTIAVIRTWDRDAPAQTAE